MNSLSPVIDDSVSTMMIILPSSSPDAESDTWTGDNVNFIIVT